MTNNIDMILMRSMYKIDRGAEGWGGGGSKNRSLGNYLMYKQLNLYLLMALQVGSNTVAKYNFG